MHTRMAPYELYLWLVLIVLQLSVGMASRRYMKVYLLSEAILGSVLLSIARLLSWQAYFRAFCVSIFAHEALLLFVVLAMIDAIRRYGLPTRRSTIPIQIAAGIAFAVAIGSSSSALALVYSPIWRLVICWDRAFQFAICLMIGFLPVYAVYVSASLPTPLILKIIGLGLYSATNAGALNKFIFCRTVTHMADFVYVGSLLIWFIAGRADREENPASTPVFELEDFPQCEG